MPRPRSFFNYFYLDGELTNTISTGEINEDLEIFPEHLFIVYHNSNIYYKLMPSGITPSYTTIINDGVLLLENVNPEYTGSFYVNPHGNGTQQDPYYLVEDEVLEAGYFSDFTTYHTTKVAQGYDSTITLTNCTCNKSAETGLTGSYSATITANEGYYLSSVTTTLGTVTIATNKKTATITITDVTEDFTITATGTAITQKDVILHPNNNGVTDYTTEILPKAMSDDSKQNTLTTNSVNDGTIAKNIGFDSQGNIVKAVPSSSGMTNPMTTADDIIVGGSSGTPARLAKGNNGELLRVNESGNVGYGKGLPIITTAPSAANTDGLIICVLSSEPSTKYSGYLYIITGSNS